jgi:glycosyltransferase involved in cell wall biosynthesis
MKKALIYNPYFDTLGGGERYTAGVIAAFHEAGYEVTVAWKDQLLSDMLRARFDLSTPFHVDNQGYLDLTQGSFIQKIRYQRQFDAVFWVSDGSLPLLVTKKNILHFQVPFSTHNARFSDTIKRLFYTHVVCNSRFTQSVISSTYHLTSSVLYPPCSTIQPGKKEPLILGVGRFDTSLHGKRQDILIDAFKRLSLSGWKLVLAGGCLQTSIVDKLQTSIQGSSISLVCNPSWSELEQLYSSASLFWHAAGFEVNDTLNPEKVEHFGIATVEAMSAGAVPLVYDAGGQREVVTHAENGFRWHTIDELIAQTRQLIDTPELMQQISLNARQASSQFTTEHFIHDFIQTILS